MKRQILLLALVSIATFNIRADSGLQKLLNWVVHLKEKVYPSAHEKTVVEKNEEQKTDEVKTQQGDEQPLFENAKNAEENKSNDATLAQEVEKTTTLEEATTDFFDEEDLSDDDAEWVIAIIWEGSVAEKDRENFLKLLELLSHQKLGAQRILRCTRHDVKNHHTLSRNVKAQYTRLKNKWRASSMDESFIQKMITFIDEIYDTAVA